MVLSLFKHHKITKFKNIEVKAKIWRAWMVLPFSMLIIQKVKYNKKLAWCIKYWLN